MGESSALTVGKNIELDLAYAAIKLLRERFVLVIEAREGIGPCRLPYPGFARRNAGVIAVVRSDHLDLIQLEAPIAVQCLALKGRNRSA